MTNRIDDFPDYPIKNKTTSYLDKVIWDLAAQVDKQILEDLSIIPRHMREKFRHLINIACREACAKAVAAQSSQRWKEEQLKEEVKRKEDRRRDLTTILGHSNNQYYARGIIIAAKTFKVIDDLEFVRLMKHHIGDDWGK